MADQQLRRFEDEEGDAWEVHPQEDFKWQVVRPEDGERKIVTPPPGTDDPHELSEEELRDLLDTGIPTGGIDEPLEPGGA